MNLEKKGIKMKEIIIYILFHVSGMLLPAWQQNPNHYYVDMCQSVQKEQCKIKRMKITKYINYVSDIIVSESRKADIDPFLTASIIRQESAYNSNAVGKIGEKGLCQLHGVAAQGNRAKLFIPAVNIRLCVKNLNSCKQRCGLDIVSIAGCHNTGQCLSRHTRYTKHIQKLIETFEKGKNRNHD